MSEIRNWLEKIDLGQYAEAFEANEINMDLIRQVDDQMLKDIGVLIAGSPVAAPQRNCPTDCHTRAERRCGPLGRGPRRAYIRQHAEGLSCLTEAAQIIQGAKPYYEAEVYRVRGDLLNVTVGRC
jgi:hypothetical protein